MQFHLGAQNRQQALVLPRLLHEVARPPAHGLDRQPHVAPRSHNDDRNAAIESYNLGKQVQAFLARGRVARVVQVDENGIVELTSERFAHRGGRLRRINYKALGAKQQLDGFQNMRLVVTGQNPSCTPPFARDGDGVAQCLLAARSLCSRQGDLRQGAVPLTASSS
jgi:hypothetical protein